MAETLSYILISKTQGQGFGRSGSIAKASVELYQAATHTMHHHLANLRTQMKCVLYVLYSKLLFFLGEQNSYPWTCFKSKW
jgi:hypothetical protein